MGWWELFMLIFPQADLVAAMQGMFTPQKLSNATNWIFFWWISLPAHSIWHRPLNLFYHNCMTSCKLLCSHFKRRTSPNLLFLDHRDNLRLRQISVHMCCRRQKNMQIWIVFIWINYAFFNTRFWAAPCNVPFYLVSFVIKHHFCSSDGDRPHSLPLVLS